MCSQPTSSAGSPIKIALASLALFFHVNALAGKANANCQKNLAGAPPITESSIVRFRGPDFQMHEGLLRSPDLSQKHVLIEHDGMLKSVAKNAVFASQGSRPVFSPNLRYSFIRTRMAMTPTVVTFLDGGARSIDVARTNGKDEAQQIKSVLRFISDRIRFGSELVHAQPASMDDVIHSGRGVCTHFAMLTAAILSEAGFELRIVLGDPSDGSERHLWLEVYNGTSQTFVVDGTNGIYVKKVGEVSAIAYADPSSFEHLFYANPSRTFYELN